MKTKAKAKPRGSWRLVLCGELILQRHSMHRMRHTIQEMLEQLDRWDAQYRVMEHMLRNNKRPK